MGEMSQALNPFLPFPVAFTEVSTEGWGIVLRLEAESHLLCQHTCYRGNPAQKSENMARSSDFNVGGNEEGLGFSIAMEHLGAGKVEITSCGQFPA